MDERLVVDRLVPGAKYRWDGQKIAEWRDARPRPSDAEMAAEWQRVKAEETAADSLRATIIGNAQSAVGKTLAELTTAERNALMALLLYNAGGVDPHTGVVQPLRDWLV